MPDTRVYRWAVNCSKWEPLKDELLSALCGVQTEERVRVMRFVYVEDVKRALLGRLLIRKCVLDELNARGGRHWNNVDVTLGRTAKGRPFLKTPDMMSTTFDFNVSHQGDFAVLTALTGKIGLVEGVASDHEIEYDVRASFVGVDVMKIEWARSKETNEFFRLMRRQLTPNEWRHVEEADDEWHRLARFYRYWCLKESYVKALGVGIGFDVGKLGFHVKDDLCLDSVTSSTTVSVDGRLETGWQFEEQMLDELHCVAVATRTSALREQPVVEKMPFKLVPLTELLKPFLEAPMTPRVDGDWESFHSKPTKN